MAQPAAPIPAATVVLVRPGALGPEVLLTHRPATMAFAADMHVFPGGRVDAGDAAPELAARSAIAAAEAAVRLGGDLDPLAALAAHVAAIRELWEEGGILLADTRAGQTDREDARAALVDGAVEFAVLSEELDLTLRTDLLQPLSRWVTPPTYPRRFDARFFAASLPETATEATIASDEVVAIDWFRPLDALDAMADGRLGLWLPTSATLQQLEYLDDPAGLAHLAPGPLGPILVDEPAQDVVRVVMPAGGGVSGQPICAYLVGRRRFVLVDPGDPTGPALERCLDEAMSRGGTIAAIALTHVDPDHHGGAEAQAERLGIPVLAGPGAGRRLPYAAREVADGERIALCDVTLTVIATPGPRPDHVAFTAGEWPPRAVLIGDLDGTRGSRTIAGPPDAEAWERSRARVDALGPAAVRLTGHPSGAARPLTAGLAADTLGP
jgi:endoribonuclease LACTB2